MSRSSATAAGSTSEAPAPSRSERDHQQRRPGAGDAGEGCRWSIFPIRDARGSGEHVGVLAAHHRFLRFSIATALAGTLLHLRRLRERLLSPVRQVERGQDDLPGMAGSVWGSGADGGYVRTWRSTANGLEATFAGACDTCLPLDEVGQVEGRELGQALYMATGGVGKQRMRRDATLRPSHIWRMMVLSSGEHPIEAKLNEDPRRGARAHAGQLVRAVDIPVRGTHGVFDAFEVRVHRPGGLRRPMQDRDIDELRGCGTGVRPSVDHQECVGGGPARACRGLRAERAQGHQGPPRAGGACGAEVRARVRGGRTWHSIGNASLGAERPTARRNGAVRSLA